MASSASAAALKTGESYTLGAGETVSENLYVGSGDVNISGNLNGDLLAAGGKIVVSGNNSKDVFLAGGSVSVLGSVKEDLRMFGGDLIVGKSVGGDLIMVGGNLHLLPESSVSGEMMAVGGSIKIDGTVIKDLTIAGGEITINGKIGGNVRVKSVEKLTLGAGAMIGGKLEYASGNEVILNEGAQVGGGIMHTPAPEWGRRNMPWKSDGDGGIFDILSLFAHVVKLAMYLAAVLLLVHFAKDKLQSASAELMANFWPETLRGFVVLVLAPLFMLGLFLTIIGIFPAMLLGLAFCGLWILAKLLSSVLIGGWLFQRFSAEKLFTVNWKSAVLGTICFLVLKNIPLVGWAAAGLLMLASFGKLCDMAYRKTREVLSK